jgi:hypothetical protein
MKTYRIEEREAVNAFICRKKLYRILRMYNNEAEGFEKRSEELEVKQQILQANATKKALPLPLALPLTC